MSPLDRLDWLRQVAADQRLTIGALRVAVAMTQWIGRDTGTCFPAVASIGAAVGMKERGTRRVLRQLETAGWITVRRTTGRTSNVYMPTTPTRYGETGLTGHDDAGSTQHGDTGSDDPNPVRDGRQPGTTVVANPVPRVPPNKVEQDEQGAASEVAGPEFTTKAGKTWRPSRALVEKLTKAYPLIDVHGEMAKAAAWCEANTGNRKTLSGMGRFLSGWIGRAKPAASADQYATPAEPVREFTLAEAEAILRGEP